MTLCCLRTNRRCRAFRCGLVCTGPYGAKFDGLVPDDVLDATALRPLMDALIEHSRRATAEFDEAFGE